MYMLMYMSEKNNVCRFILLNLYFFVLIDVREYTLKFWSVSLCYFYATDTATATTTIVTTTIIAIATTTAMYYCNLIEG
jgi:hypothetical protein